MDDTSIGILTGAGVSIITIVVTKTFDLLTISKEHKLQLKKEFFLKKLNAIEKSVSLYTAAYSLITNITIISEKFSKEGIAADPEQIDLIFKKIGDSFNQVYENTQEAAASLSLYVGFLDDRKSTKLLSSFWELMAEVSTITESLKSGYKLFEEADAYTKKNIQITIDEQEKNWNNCILKLKKISNALTEESKTSIIILRNHLTQYQ